MRKNKPLDESRESGQASGTKMAIYSFFFYRLLRRNITAYPEITR
ncbi:hypothetical protein Hanom_Chr03g00270781 [Helianthus anomalus]